MAKSARRNQKKNRSSKRRRVVKGGSGAADWALATFGGPGQQHAQAGSNLIAVRDASVPVVVAGQAGGMLALTPAQAGGMGHLSPAVLKGGKKGGALLALSPMTLSEVKNVNDVANVVKGGTIVFQIPEGMEKGDPVTTTDQDAASDETNQYFKDTTNDILFMLKPAAHEGEALPAVEEEPVVVPALPAVVDGEGEPPADQGEPVTGGSLLNDIAVPAVLLLGNRMFRGKRSSAKRNAKRNPKRTSSRRARR